MGSLIIFVLAVAACDDVTGTSCGNFGSARCDEECCKGDCAIGGRCWKGEDGKCIARQSEDCRRSENCLNLGACVLKNGVCNVELGVDCEKSLGCRALGWFLPQHADHHGWMLQDTGVQGVGSVLRQAWHLRGELRSPLHGVRCVQRGRRLPPGRRRDWRQILVQPGPSNRLRKVAGLPNGGTLPDDHDDLRELARAHIVRSHVGRPLQAVHRVQDTGQVHHLQGLLRKALTHPQPWVEVHRR